MKIGSTFNHEVYGPLKITKKRYSRMGNKSLWIGVDENGEDHELDGTEKPAKMEKESPKFLKEAAEVLGMAQGPKGEDADEDYIIEAVIPRVLEQIRQPENGKDGADADVELIIREMLPLVMEKMPRPKELNEALIIQRVVSRIRIPQDGKPGEKGKDGSPDTPVQVKEKLETLKGDERLDASAIKNLPKPTVQFGGDSYTGLAKIDSAGTPGTLQDKLVAGTNVTITKVNDTLRITSSGGVGGGQVDSIVAGNNIDVDATDPANPIVSVETLTLADVSDITASAVEVNVLDGIPATLTATELGYMDGVTSAVQTQLNGKVSDTGDTMTGNLAITIPNSGNALAATITQNDTTNNPHAVSITNAGTGASLFIDANGATSASTSVGGAILLDNTGNTGAGLVIYSNAGASSGRLMNIRADNVLFDQPALHIDYDGTANAFEILHNSTDSSANAISVVSVNQNDSTVGITGQESGKGTIKITHNKPDGVADASAAAISLSLGRVNAGETSAAQGIFLDTTHATTGKLINLRNNGSEKFVVTADGIAQHTNSSDSSSVQVAIFEGDRATPAANDEAYISLRLSDSAGNQDDFARITVVASTVTSASESSNLDFSLFQSGTFAKRLRMSNTSLRPFSNDGLTLGSSSERWSDLFLASGAVINFNAGDVTLTHSARSLGLNGNLTTTIASAANLVGMTVVQNDTTNNPKGISVTNSGTGNAIFIDANGNTGSAASSSGALFLENTGNLGIGANFYSNAGAGQGVSLVFMKQDNALADKPVLRIDNDGTQYALTINNNLATSTVPAIHVANAGLSNNLSLTKSNTSNTNPVIDITNNASSSVGIQITHTDAANSQGLIKLISPSPEIEFVESDQSTPAGKFEIRGQNNQFTVNSRNSGDSSFENVITIDQLASGGKTKFFGAIETVSTIELGHATDTTLSRLASGTLAVEGIRVQTTTPLVVSAASYTTDTGSSLNMDNLDIFVITAQAGALLFNSPGGTLVQGRKLMIRIKDNGTARALTWNAVFRAMGTALPSTTVLSKTLYLGFVYNSTDTKWDLIASAQEA